MRNPRQGNYKAETVMSILANLRVGHVYLIDWSLGEYIQTQSMDS